MLSTQQYHAMTQEMYFTPNRSLISSTLKFCGKDPMAATEQVLRMSPDEFCAIARDAVGSKFLQEQLSINHELYKKVFETILDNDLMVCLAKDNFGNFVIQKMIAELQREPNSIYASAFFDMVQQNSLELSFNRYACRVVQQFVNCVPNRARCLLDTFEGLEGKAAKDQNANHIVQRVLDKCAPVVYAPFVKAFVNSSGLNNGLKSVIEDKYGCRVVQMCLERVVKFCQDATKSPDEKKYAYELLHVLIKPILRGAKEFSENEFANYIVQFVICTDFLSLQREYIIKNCILHNVLWLSQGKYASHVVEKALVWADPNSLRAIVWEILDGYEKDARGRDALDIMLFDQFANYVIQRLLIISIEAYEGKRPGDAIWFDKIASRVKRCAENLERYSSGKKILNVLHQVTNGNLRNTCVRFYV